MQILLKALAVQGFRSFRADTLFSFAAKTGFYLMTGENRLNPELGANGVGKSTIWDALTWVLYGKTTRGLRGTAVANWEQNDLTSVVIKFKAGDDKYVLTRTHDPNSLALVTNGGEPKVVTQEEVQALVRMDYSTWLHTVMMGQFNRFFFDLGPAEKLAVFSEALQLGYWQERSAKASSKAGKLDAAVREGEQGLAKLRGSIEVLRASIAASKKEVGQYEEARKVKLCFLGEKVRDASYRCKQLERKANKLRAKRDALEQKVRKRQKEIVACDDAMRAAQVKVRDAEELVRAANRCITDYKAHIDKLHKLTGECPTCRQKLKDSQVDRAVDEIERLKQWEEGELGRANDEQVAQQKLVRLAARALQRAGRRLGKAQTRHAKAIGRAGTGFGAAKAATASLEALRGQINEAKAAANPYKQQLERDQVALRHAQADKNQLKHYLQDDQRKHAAATYWVKGFKELRLWLIEEALLEFEVEVNNSLVQLGLEGWVVKFDVERETKAGGISKGFTVNITSPDSHEPVPWEAWCGGETQRLRIAGAIGLSNLICNRLGIRPAIEVWDEPTAHLSEEGIADLLNFFSARARTEHKQVWLVDHRSLNYGSFDGQVLVVKDDMGSHITGKEV